MKNYWLKKHHQTSVWDFRTEIGDMIKEKYKSLYIKVVEVSWPRWERKKELLVDQINTDSGDSAI